MDEGPPIDRSLGVLDPVLAPGAHPFGMEAALRQLREFTLVSGFYG
jgi:hypothetical protein